MDRKPLFIALGIVLVLAVVVFGAEIWIKSKVRNLVADITNVQADLEHIEVGRIRVSLINRSFRLEDVTIRTKGNKSTVELGRIAARGIGFKKKDGKYSIRVRSIAVVSPRIVVNSSTGDLHRQKEPDAKGGGITEMFDLIAIGSVELDNGYVEYNFIDKKVNMAAGGINLSADSIIIDSTYNGGKILDERITASIDSVWYLSDEGFLLVRADSIKLDTHAREFSVAQFNLLPQVYSKYEYAAKVPDNPDWTQLTAGPVECFGVDYPALLTDSILKVDSIYVAHGIVESFKNQKINVLQKEKPLFWEQLQQLPLKVNIPIVVAEHFRITYEELAENGDEPGKITFQEAKGDFRGLTNIPAGVAADQAGARGEAGARTHFTLYTETRIMEQAGEAKVTFKFPITHASGVVEVTGHVGTLSMPAFNPMAIPLGNIRIESGVMKSLDFNITANSSMSNINATMLYDDLSITILKKNDDGILQQRKFLTRIVDNIIVRSSNPRNNGNIRTAEGTFERNPYKSQFNYLWKTIFTGVEKVIL